MKIASIYACLAFLLEPVCNCLKATDGEYQSLNGALYSHRKSSWLNTVCFIYVTCLCVLAPEIWYQMATNKCVILFYTLLLKLKLVSHFLSNRHEFFTQANLIVLLKKSGFQFLISILNVELYGIKLWDCVPQQTH